MIVANRGPLDDASGHGHRHVAEALRSQPERIVELIDASSEGDLAAIQRMVARGINLEAADYDLRTPLHLAAAEGQERIVQYFLDQGVDRSPLDRWGRTPLDEAERHGHSRVVALLKT